MGETSHALGVFQGNTLFMGGEHGDDMALMFHKYPLEGAKYVGSGIYVGGLKKAKEHVESRQAHPRDFKFTFNYVSWLPGLLKKEIEAKRWDVVRIPPSMVLEQRPESSLWSKCRAKLAADGLLNLTPNDQDDTGF
jgi:putative AlgH/UPF0301 family transcriptional regulator